MGRRENGVEREGGGDFEAIIVLHGMERIWPLRKRAVKTVKGSVRFVLSGEGRACMLEGRREGCVREVSGEVESGNGRSDRGSTRTSCQSSESSDLLLGWRPVMAGFVTSWSMRSMSCQLGEAMASTCSRSLLVCKSTVTGSATS